MRKLILLIAVLLMAAPVMAEPVVTLVTNIGGTDSNGVTTIDVTYAVTGSSHLVRAFGLTLQCDANDANILDVIPADANYRIFPSQISIVGGEVNEYKTPYDPCDIGEPNLDVEMGSLYTFDSNYASDANAGYGMQPGLAGPLFTVKINNLGCLDVNENPLTGGVVMEDPNEDATVISEGNCISIDRCYAGQPDEDQWIEVGEPNCWCFPRQCHGDADGHKTGSAYLGYTYVNSDDLDIMSVGWNVKDPPKGSGILNLSFNGVPVACADFMHDKQGSAYLGYVRVGSNDLDEMSIYWLVKEPTKGSGTPANCSPGNRGTSW